ncbi:MAG: DUF58 domain-containing protein [Planctomycetota bacterium]
MDPELLKSISGLELKARLIVEGFVSGMHRSPFHGFSVEFAEHREYVPGDDTRFVDWKVYGKSDRYYIKQYEEETNLRCWILLDCSESMAYQGGAVRTVRSGGEAGGPSMSKIDYARHAAAALAYLVSQQSDAIGLCLFDDELRQVIPPASSAGHIRMLIQTLADVQTRGRTNIKDAIQHAAERLGRRGVVVIISDLLDSPDAVLSAIRRLRHQNHEVILFHLLDHEERTFPFERMIRFDGMEDMPTVTADPAALRLQYLKELDEFTRTIKHGCLGTGADFVPLDTRMQLDVTLSSYLASRSHKSGGRGKR